MVFLCLACAVMVDGFGLLCPCNGNIIIGVFVGGWRFGGFAVEAPKNDKC